MTSPDLTICDEKMYTMSAHRGLIDEEMLENKISESPKSLVMLQFPKSAKPEQLTPRTEGVFRDSPRQTEQLVTLMLTALTRLTNLRQKSKAKFNCSGELTKALDVSSCSRAVDFIYRKKRKKARGEPKNRTELKWEKELGRRRQRS